MASIGKHGNGKRLWLHHKTDKRIQIYLGKVSKMQEREILRVVEPLESAAKLGLEPTTSEVRAAENLSERLRNKLHAHGLLKRRNARLTIGAFGRSWIRDYRSDLGDKRKQDYLTTIRMLEEYFGKNKVINDITVGEAKSFRVKLSQKNAEATVAGRIKMAKCLFSAAVDFGYISASPFSKVKSGSQNNDRFQYIPKETIKAILDDVTCLEWKALIVLWRFAGLRSQEPLHLSWDCIDWGNRRMTVNEPKNKRQRIIPLWPEVEEALSHLFEVAQEGESRIFTKYKIGQKLGTQFCRIIKRAGFDVWPKPIQNLRASCQNDLEAAGHRITAVCNWIGNSKLVASRHYLKVTEEDFQRALKKDMVINMVIDDHHNLKKNQLAAEKSLLPQFTSNTKREKHPLKDCHNAHRKCTYLHRQSLEYYQATESSSSIESPNGKIGIGRPLKSG